MQQNIVLQLPPVNQKPSWDPATKSAFMQATYQCKSQMRASVQLTQSPSGLIMMPQIPSSPYTRYAPTVAAPQAPPPAAPATLGVQGTAPATEGNGNPEAGGSIQGQAESSPQEALPPGVAPAPGL
jgi:hypothetical protein